MVSMSYILGPFKCLPLIYNYALEYEVFVKIW